MSNKAREYLQNGLLIAAVLEVVQDSASRAKSIWARMGGFIATFAAATVATALIDKCVSWVTGKSHAKQPEYDNASAYAPPSHPADQGKSNWAQDVTEKKHTCSCQHRK